MMIDSQGDASFLTQLFQAIPSLPHRHATTDPIWRVWDYAARDAIARSFGRDTEQKINFGPFGEIDFPFTPMGAINSCDLFGLDELIIFSFYHCNRNRYSRVVDFGANIGLHSLLLSRCGFEVRSFEPDPGHADLFRRTMSRNSARIDLHEAAISLADGRLEFTRVLGNTTSSHLSGAKLAPYGDLERFSVAVEAAGPHLAWADLAKIDIEGHETELLAGLPLDTWHSTDAVVEIGNEANADAIFSRFRRSDINLFSQKTGWRKVEQLTDVPTSHRDGSLFISARPEMPWTIA